MKVYAAGNLVKVAVPLVDTDETALSVTSVRYRVVDEKGAEIAPLAALADFESGAAEAAVEVTAEQNELPEGVLRAGRQIDLELTLEDGNVAWKRHIYAIEALDALVTGVNTFQSYAEALLTARDIGSVVGWENATEPERQAALRDARDHVCQLRFSNLLSGLPTTMWPAAGTLTTPDLSELTPEEFAALPPAFLTALKKAQIAEANAILGDDPVGDKRREGLVLDTIGESKQMYRTGKPLQFPVCRRAATFLSRYISYSLSIGRA